MNIHIYSTDKECGQAAAEAGASLLRAVLKEKEFATIVVATGASQFEMLAHLVESPGISWNRVRGFHLDEYIGIPITHPASFRLYLWQRFVSRLPIPLHSFCYLDGERDPDKEARRASETLNLALPIDVAFIGIGENGHLAFNDPPADFTTKEPYILVELDEACRAQQMGEGWFASMDQVPRKAISMSVHHIMQSSHIICTVPDQRKAKAVMQTVEGEVRPEVPASMLQRHQHCALFLDTFSASLLNKSR